jgi:hypothetical protein
MSTQTPIPQGLRVAYLANFIFALIFGLAGTFAAKLVGDLANHPVRDVDVNAMLGVASLAFALGSWLAYKATTWEQIGILTAMLAFSNLFGGITGAIAFFFPSIFGLLEPYPPVQLLVAVILIAFGSAFAYFYFSVRPAHALARNEAPAPAK